MAYGLRYTCQFLNDFDETCRLEIYAKDYSGIVEEVEGSASPFKLSKELDYAFEPVQAQVANIELCANYRTNFNLDSFYSEDDDYWMVKFYVIPLGGIQTVFFYSGSDNSASFNHTSTDNRITFGNQTSDHGIKAGQQLIVEGKTYDIESVSYSSGLQNLELFVTQTVTTHFVSTPLNFTINTVLDNGLKFVGFVYQEDSGEGFIDFDHYIQLTANDHLGSLSNITFSEAYTGTNIYQKFTVAQYLQIILSATSLSLPLQVFANIYENTMQDRTGSNTATFIDQTCIYSGRFANEDGSWLPCFDILTELMEDFGCVLCQRAGKWIMYRPAEFRLATGNAIPGTEISASFLTKTAVTLDITPIQLSERLRDTMVGAENNLLRNTRPYKFTEETFDFTQPAQLLRDSDLQEVGALLRTTNVTDDDVNYIYREYAMPSYFQHQNAAPESTPFDTSFIRVISTVISDGNDNNIETEKERYIVTPFTGHEFKWLQFSPVEVSAGDSFDFSCQVKALQSSSKPLRVNFRFDLFFTNLSGVTDVISLSAYHFPDTTYGQWTWTVADPAFFRAGDGISFDVQFNVEDFNPFALSGNLAEGWKLPKFPFDGILIVSIDGANTTLNNGSLAQVDVATNEINLTMYNRINDAYNVSGQTHTQTQNLATGQVIKNSNTRARNIDDSPRNPIAGTLFINTITHFTGINLDAYMTKTIWWHRFNYAESLRLGQITTGDLKQVYGQLRRAIDCSIYFDSSIDLLTIWKLEWEPMLNFIMARIESIDYRNNLIQCTLVEVWTDGESDVSANYKFEYQFEKTK